MRHAAPRRRNRALARLAAAIVAYVAGLLLTAGITLVGVIAVWALWGWLGVR